METRSRVPILCVDDEPNVLEGLSLNLRRLCEVVTATNGPEGLEILQKRQDIAVIVSDMRMPVMNGAIFLTRARQAAPDATRMLLTGHADLDSAIAAVNEGQIFRFLTKPCPPDTLIQVMGTAIEQHRLVTAERVLLEQTLRGSIKALTEVLALANPVSFGRATRIRTRATAVAAKMGMGECWQVEVAAMLSQLGYVAVPSEVAEKARSGTALSETEQKIVGRVFDVAGQLLRDIPRLEVVRGILTVCGMPDNTRPNFNEAEKVLVTRGGQILKAVLDFDTLEELGNTTAGAIEKMRKKGVAYDGAVLDELAASVGSSAEMKIVTLPLSALHEGMVFADDVKTVSGTLLIARGHEITAGLLARISNFRQGTVREPVRVMLTKF